MKLKIKTFTRFMRSETIAKYLADARRQGYSVRKRPETFVVKNDGELVFQGLLTDGRDEDGRYDDTTIWLVWLSTEYYNESYAYPC